MRISYAPQLGMRNAEYWGQNWKPTLCSSSAKEELCGEIGETLFHLFSDTHLLYKTNPCSRAEYTVSSRLHIFTSSSILQIILSSFNWREKNLYFKGLSISKTNESNLPTEKQSFGLRVFKRKTEMSSLLMAYKEDRWPLWHETKCMICLPPLNR